MIGCANCGRPLVEHRCVHVVPCCPGRCVGEFAQTQAEIRRLPQIAYVLGADPQGSAA